MSYSGQDRRKFPRIIGRFIVSYRIMDEANDVDITQTKNLGLGGMLLTTNRMFNPGINLALEIRLPFDPHPIMLVGRVVESSEIVRDMIYDTRIEFTAVDERHKRVIGETVNYFIGKEKDINNEKVNVGLVGFGNVGSGVVKILRERKTLLSEKIGLEINLVKVCDQDTLSRRSVNIDKSIFIRDPKEIINDPQIDILIELIGGIHPAKEFIIEALRKGKHVVTANKALLALHGQELFTEAADRGKNIYFEASVGAGIPIIKSLREGLVANRFQSIFGIVNGTSNYILSSMSKNNCGFASALKEARAKGFAEKDPSLDIEGMDSAHKLILLTYLAFGRFVSLKEVFVEGIARISQADVNYAKELGFEIKLLAIAKKEGGDLEVRVHPTLISKNHLLASVDGVFNAIYVSGDLAGNLLFYGPGAGQSSAASAVVSDLVDLTQDIKAGLFRSTLNIVPDKTIKKLRKIDDFESRYYIRFMARDLPGVLAKVSGVLAKFGISIASVTQKERSRTQLVPIVMLIHEAREKDLRAALSIIDRMESIKEKPVAIRMEEV